MHRPTNLLFALALFAAPAFAGNVTETQPAGWPTWRGPLETGASPDAAPPVEWSESKNIKWKKEIPGSGHASPIVWGDMVIVLTAVSTDPSAEIPEQREIVRPEPGERRGPPGDGRGERGERGPRGDRGGRGGFGSDPAPQSAYRFSVMALDRHTGEVLWEKVAGEVVPHEGIHRTGSWASASPITDGEHIVAFFGSRGLYVYDMDGNLQWEKDLGDMTIKRGFGEGSTPALHGDNLVVNWDHEEGSFIVALDKATGEEKWRTPRDERTTWTSPLVVEAGGRTQVIVNGTNKIRAYDISNGELIWECGGMTQNVIPTPILGNGLVYLASGFRGAALLAIDPAKAEGDVTGTDAVVWSYDENTPYVSTPLLYGDYLYFHKGNENILTCLNAKTGEEVFSGQRIEGITQVYSSPTGAGGRVYVVSRDGVTVVLERGEEFKVLAANTLDDSFSATPAIVGNSIYLRGQSALYCIAETN